MKSSFSHGMCSSFFFLKNKKSRTVGTFSSVGKMRELRRIVKLSEDFGSHDISALNLQIIQLPYNSRAFKIFLFNLKKKNKMRKI